MSKALILLSSNKNEVKKLGLAKHATLIDKDVDVAFANKDYDYITLINKSPTTPQEARDLGGNMFKKYKSKATEIVFNLPRLNDVKEGAALASYEFNKYKTKPEENTLQVEDAGISASVHFARDLVTEPGNALYPEKYADRINETLSHMELKCV